MIAWCSRRSYESVKNHGTGSGRGVSAANTRALGHSSRQKFPEDWGQMLHKNYLVSRYHALAHWRCFKPVQPSKAEHLGRRKVSYAPIVISPGFLTERVQGSSVSLMCPRPLSWGLYIIIYVTCAFARVNRQSNTCLPIGRCYTSPRKRWP